MRKDSKTLKPTKLTSGIKTVNDLLARSDVNDVLSDVIKDKADIKDIMVIYRKRGEPGLNFSYTMDEPDAIYALDRVKFMLHSGGGE